MQRLADRPLAPSSSNWQAPSGVADVVLAQIETWITAPAKGGGGWSEVKPCLLLRVITTDAE
jgi:hypothetical protein